jgi:hypothetical protein
MSVATFHAFSATSRALPGLYYRILDSAIVPSPALIPRACTEH